MADDVGGRVHTLDAIHRKGSQLFFVVQNALSLIFHSPHSQTLDSNMAMAVNVGADEQASHRHILVTGFPSTTC